MQRFRAFTSAGWDDDVARMDRAINDWLENDHPHIHMMAQAEFGGHLVVSFVYADSFQMATAAEAASVAEVFERRLEGGNLGGAGDEMVVPLPVVELPY